jgi:hypothetical protein
MIVDSKKISAFECAAVVTACFGFVILGSIAYFSFPDQGQKNIAAGVRVLNLSESAYAQYKTMQIAVLSFHDFFPAFNQAFITTVAIDQELSWLSQKSKFAYSHASKVAGNILENIAQAERTARQSENSKHVFYQSESRDIFMAFFERLDQSASLSSKASSRYAELAFGDIGKPHQ